MVAAWWSPRSALRSEWLIEDAGANSLILFGVTALNTPTTGQKFCSSPSSRMHFCFDLRAWPGGRDWGASGRRAAGDRVGLLVDQGRLSVFVNGARLGPGPMAGDLPPHVRSCADLFRAGSRGRVVAGARPPPGS